jgi:hypothetical protein
VGDPDALIGTDALQEGLHHARLADAGLAGHEHDLPDAAPRRLQLPLEPVEHGLAPDEMGRTAISGTGRERGIARRSPR